MTKQDTMALVEALIEGFEKNDSDMAGKAAAAIAYTFMDNQERQTAAMERLAVAMEAQVALVEKQVNALTEVKA